ncbi:hypothetical protein L293_0993 [Acinetobacter gyllenbergii CIP 110306 = MTCC 11365]|nr:hypothetical protein L293_0993 [Acinetobacter gyllenbergii CIP 110306 = MTCC 11365]
MDVLENSLQGFALLYIFQLNSDLEKEKENEWMLVQFSLN